MIPRPLASGDGAGLPQRRLDASRPFSKRDSHQFCDRHPSSNLDVGNHIYLLVKQNISTSHSRKTLLYVLGILEGAINRMASLLSSLGLTDPNKIQPSVPRAFPDHRYTSKYHRFRGERESNGKHDR
jgi:hypothetical protein